MGTSPTEGHGVSVRDYRARLEERHRHEQRISQEAIQRAALVFNLTRLTNRLWQDFEGIHRSYGATWAGFRILNVLWTVGPTRQNDVARLSGSSRATISSTLRTLERAGLVQRSPDPNDGRMNTVQLTHEGREALRQGIGAQVAREAAWFDVLTPREQRQLSRLLAKVADRPTPAAL